MKKNLFNKVLWEKLALGFLTTFTVIIALTILAVSKGNTINAELRLQTYKVIQDENDTTDTNYFPLMFDNQTDLEAYCRETCMDIEGEGLVLLKNENNALPLSENNRVSMLLSGSVDTFYSTHGSGRVYANQCVNFKDALTDEGLIVNNVLYEFYKTSPGKTGRVLAMNDLLGYKIFKTNECEWSKYTLQAKSSIEEYSDAAIVVVTRMSGEGDDVSFAYSDGRDGSYLSLTQSEYEILQKLTELKLQNKLDKIVVLINSACALCADFLFDDSLSIDACMWIGCPGGTGTKAVAKALTGKINPSGRLSDTYVKNNFNSPATAYWKLNDGFANVYENADAINLNGTQKYYGVYVENIYVGYRYFETRYEDYVSDRDGVGNYSYSNDVAYTFGHGLSYTTFEYSDFNVEESADHKSYTVSVKVTNTGTKAGKETVQVYMQKPYTEYDENNYIEKASIELAGFAKTQVLEPNAFEVVTIKVSKELFKSYDAYGAMTYILEEGDYYLAVGKNAHDALNNIIMLKRDNGETYALSRMVGEGNKELASLALEQDEFDDYTYSVTSETGYQVTNQLDFADPNRYDGFDNPETVTYVSRYDWTQTFPKEAISLSVDTDKMRYDISSHKAITEDGSAMPKFGESNGMTLIQMRGKAYGDADWDKVLDQIEEGEMQQFVTGCIGITPAIQSIMKPMTDEDDGPYGVSHSPYDYSSMPSEGIIASTFNTDLYEKVGTAIAADARLQNLHGLYAPGLNIHRCQFSGRNSEYYSEDPILSAVASTIETLAIQEQGVVCHIKHWILNDEESHRNGINIWLNEQSAREIYLLPWEWSLRQANANYDLAGNSHAIMTSFNRIGTIWTSASPELMYTILRSEWGFDGYALTDMADSNAGMFMTYDDGFMNGTDCFLGAGSDSELSQWMSSPTFANKIREATHRMLYIFANYSASLNGFSASTRFVRILTWWESLVIALNVVFGLLAIGSTTMLVISTFKKEV